MSSSLYAYNRYNLRKEQGLCVTCGKVKPVEGKTQCQACKDRNANYQKKSRKMFDELGLCVRCGKEKQAIGFKMCPECIEKSNEINRKSVRRTGGLEKKYKHRKKKGICVSCGNPAAEGRVRCESCIEKHKAYQKKYELKKKFGKASRSDRYSLGLCYLCGNPLDTDKRFCSKCCDMAIKNVKSNWKKDYSQHTWSKDNNLVFGGVNNG